MIQQKKWIFFVHFLDAQYFVYSFYCHINASNLENIYIFMFEYCFKQNYQNICSVISSRCEDDDAFTEFPQCSHTDLLADKAGVLTQNQPPCVWARY